MARCGAAPRPIAGAPAADCVNPITESRNTNTYNPMH